jgi:hypothetical protein
VRPIDQTTYGILDGNCFSACIASILEISLRDVPHFLGPRQPWFSQWLAGRGLRASLYQSDTYMPWGFSIAGGPSARFAGRMHACVAFDGVVVHDPHPSRDGLPLGVVEYVVIHGCPDDRLASTL